MKISHFKVSRVPASCVLSLLLGACGGTDTSVLLPGGAEGEPEGVSGVEGSPVSESFVEGADIASAFVPEPLLVTAELRLKDDDLVLSLHNQTDVTGNVVLRAVVENPEGSFFTELPDSVLMQAHASVELTLSPSDVDGLRLLSHEWTNARLNFEYGLEDGRRGGHFVSVFAEHGLPAEPSDVPFTGRSYGFPELAEDVVVADTVDKAANVTLCFSHNVTFSGATENSIDVLKTTTAQIPASFNNIAKIKRPDGSISTSLDTLDTNGCKTVPRQIGRWTFDLDLKGPNVFGGVALFPGYIVARRQDGTTPVRSVNIDVAGLEDTPARVAFSMPAGADLELQTAYALVGHTLKRVGLFGANIDGPAALIVQLNAAGGSATYDPTTNKLNVTQSGGTPGSAVSRRVVAHETGHFLHNQYLRSTVTDIHLDYTYCVPGNGRNGDPDCVVPPDDGCGRTTGSTQHTFLGVEWSSSAHLEGFANFIAALAYNSPSAGANCFLPDISGPLADKFSCEGQGKQLLMGGPTGTKQCYEWTRPIFGSVGIEQDFTKLYWDLFTDKGASLKRYLDGEASQTSGWTRGNHVDKILAGLAEPEDSMFRAAGSGNIWEGCQGIQSAGGDVCCAYSCGRCGGENCDDLPGGSGSCCVGTIRTANISCTVRDAPCVIPAPPPP